jgi:hypothetical protein
MVVPHMTRTVMIATLLATIVMTPLPAIGQEIPQVILFDPYMTPVAGAQGLLTVQHLVAAAEDRWLPTKIGEERSRPALALGILYRAGKLLGLDVPQDHFLMVVGHEVFGHGARFRELGDGRIGYGFDAPIPYGSGEAFTSFEGEFPVSPLGLLAVSASGIEAQHAIADAITDKAVTRGRIHYREAWLYFESRLTAMTYILTASPHSSAGHDVADFLETFHDACTAPCMPLTRRHVQQRALLALADPLLFYALYGFSGAYIGNGSTTGPIPMIPVGGGARVLPSAGYALTPYGGEWTVRTAIATGKQGHGRRIRLRGITLRVGDTGASTPWAVGARAAHVLRVKGLVFDAAVDVWRQPPLLADRTSDPLRTGAAVTATVILPLPHWLRSDWTRGLHLTAGYKAEGFVPGEQLGRGVVLRAGVRVR